MTDRGFIKPFLLLQSLPDKAASDAEFATFKTYCALTDKQLKRVNMARGEFPQLYLSNYSAVIMPNGPYEITAPHGQKPAEQKEFEPWLAGLLAEIIHDDTPFLGISYGMEALIKMKGGVISSEFAEPVGMSEVILSADSKVDPITFDMPEKFMAFVDHPGEGVGHVPEGTVSLARSADCIEMIRVGQNVYATQFHPEVINVRGDGYTEPIKILTRFVDRYSTPFATDANAPTTSEAKPWL